MEEGYFPAKLKRKDLDEVDDDLCGFSLSSPARKIRRLDAELPPIIEEEETLNPVVFGQPPPSQDAFVEPVRGSSIAIDELGGSLPENEERAIVLFDPMNNMPRLQTQQPFSISVNSDLLSGFKNPVLWSTRLNPLESLEGEREEDGKYGPNNGCLAVVPWVPKNSEHRALPEVEVPQMEVCEMMDTDDPEAMIMDVEDNDSQQMPRNEFGSVTAGEGVSQWQQHCMIPQPPCNFSTPVAWSGA